MKRKKLYIAVLLLAGVLTSCKVGKAMSVPIFICPIAWRNIRIQSASATRIGKTYTQMQPCRT